VGLRIVLARPHEHEPPNAQDQQMNRLIIILSSLTRGWGQVKMDGGTFWGKFYTEVTILLQRTLHCLKKQILLP
jgi:hypothetical protein